ncbi:MAG: hypothetical protein ACE368_07200 [Paracoccaceae bacterium]
MVGDLETGCRRTARAIRIDGLGFKHMSSPAADTQMTDGQAKMFDEDAAMPARSAAGKPSVLR